MRRRIRMSIDWLPRRWPYFAIGFEFGEFRLYLWIAEIKIWRSY